MTTWVTGSPEMKSRFVLDPTVTYLNHGSFGACPREVLDAQSRHRAAMEAEPVDYLVRQLPGLFQTARARLSRFLHADPAGLLFVPNATTAVATVLASFDWREGDEIVFADHGYNAVRVAIHLLERRYGVRLRRAELPFPLERPEQLADAYLQVLGPRTRLLLLDHLTSPTALVLPAADIVAEARRRGIPTLVDGAHAPGSLPLDLDAMGADFYTGNLHKWLFTPKGCAFLQVAAPWRDLLRPLVASHGYFGDLHEAFDWTGTCDPTPWTCLPETLDAFEALGPDEVRRSNHHLVREGRERIARALGVTLPHPDDPALYGPMAAIPFPSGGEASPERLAALNRHLYETHRIEVPFTAYDARIWLRISGQVYNHPADFERLARALARQA